MRLSYNDVIKMHEEDEKRRADYQKKIDDLKNVVDDFTTQSIQLNPLEIKLGDKK